MYIKCKLSILLAIILLGYGCSNEDSDWSPGEKLTPVQFFSESINIANSTAGTTESLWNKYADIGMFMIKHNQVLNMNSILEGSYNQWYKSNNAGVFDPRYTENTIFFPMNNEKVDFISYYPYQHPSSLSNSFQFNIRLHGYKNISEDYGVLYVRANNEGKGYDKFDKASIHLKFKRVMSQLVVNVEKGVGMGNVDLSMMEVEVEGRSSSAKFDLTDGKSFSELAVEGAIKLVSTAGDKLTYRAALIPEGKKTKSQVVFKLNKDKFYWDISDIDFAQGKQYIYTVTINKTGISVSDNISIVDWEDNGEKETGDAILPQLNIEYVDIPTGSFRMGDDDGFNSAKPSHTVYLTKEFEMSKCEITNAQYAAFLNNNLSKIGYGAYGNTGVAYGAFFLSDPDKILVRDSKKVWERGIWRDEYGVWHPFKGYENHPVIYVSWYGAMAFAEWVGGTLPTEAQWEYACRAGSNEKWPTGSNGVTSIVQEYGWFKNNSNSLTQRVGQLKPNEWGLYDMYGNVYEWCLDEHRVYSSSSVYDPIGPVDTDRTTIRGGSVNHESYSATKIQDHPKDAKPSIVGFRVIRYK